ncbi:MAG TPA: methyltransferase domain-containing protein [Acidimicrobiales bacterium]|jgi:ubiquinone/menaquinone biosynthesis C-methylase UbiE|nr:methyltransferase domain-containing protein [Acidimicrobiales bacterium]
MKNILRVAPQGDLHGIPLQATRMVEKEDLSGRDVLDVGCGFGWFEIFALSYGVRSIVGTDISDADLNTARAHIQSPSARFEVGSAVEMPFDDGSFDTVVCWEVLEHIPRGTEPQAFREIRRVLRPGGHLYLSTPHASWSARAFDPAWWLVGHRHYTTSNLRRLAEEAAFSIETIEVRGGGWLIASILDLYVAKWIFRRSPFFGDQINRRVDSELANPTGSAACFMKCRA